MRTCGNRCVNGATRSSRRPVRRNAAVSIDAMMGRHSPSEAYFYFAFARYFAGSMAAWLAY
jgi:hypothetical protein